MTKFIQCNFNMCESLSLFMVCEQGVVKSHNILEKTVRKKQKKSKFAEPNYV